MTDARAAHIAAVRASLSSDLARLFFDSLMRRTEPQEQK